MSSNISQIYLANPATTLLNNDLMYLGRSPYSSTDDRAFLFATLLAYIPFGISTTVTTTSQNMVANATYTANNAALVSLLLPATAAGGTVLQITGLGAGGWTITQNPGQNIQVGNISTSIGTGGSISSTNRYNTITMKCIVANTTWIVVGSQGTFTIV